MTKEEALKKIEENEKNISELKGYVEGLDKPKGAWKPGIQERWFCVTDVGSVISDLWYETPEDKFMLLTGNCFETEVEAEEYLEYIKALGTVTHYILEGNEGELGKCAVLYDSRTGEFSTRRDVYYNCGSKLPNTKSEWLADEVISKFDKELRIIFKIK